MHDLFVCAACPREARLHAGHPPSRAPDAEDKGGQTEALLVPAGDVTPWARVLLDVRHGGQHAAHPGQEGVWAHLMEVQRAQAWPHVGL